MLLYSTFARKYLTSIYADNESHLHHLRHSLTLGSIAVCHMGSQGLNTLRLQLLLISYQDLRLIRRTLAARSADKTSTRALTCKCRDYSRAASPFGVHSAAIGTVFLRLALMGMEYLKKCGHDYSKRQRRRIC